ncbi:MAG TPA: hypothetical protein VNJ08_02445 [Bacteriovoracaceae bacterium]|nr:hypothetical protein [Bacteriovoracaceae bacterium]
MLWTFSRKLCPLLSLAIATVGCGKKISEGKTESSQSVEGQELPAVLVLKLNTTENNIKSYSVPKNANIKLPETLWVRSGNPAGKVVTITYNLETLTSEDFGYECSYKAAGSLTEMPLDYCINGYGEIFSNATDFEFPIFYGKFIKMEMKNAVPGLILDANYSVDWK